ASWLRSESLWSTLPVYWSSLKATDGANVDSPTGNCPAPAGDRTCGLGIAYCPFANLKFSSASATGLMLEPSQATCVPPACVRKGAAVRPGAAGQNCAPSVAADLSCVSYGSNTVVAPPTPFSDRVP